ncbi:MAG: ADOP family duplicated permease [Vicinamibacterales bacterium]
MTDRQPDGDGRRARDAAPARAERLYALLLRSYPPAFRARFAGAMTQAFRDRRREAAALGARARAAFWFVAIHDAVRNGLAERMAARRWTRSNGATDHAAADAGRTRASFLAQDLRDAVRSFRRFPGVALTVVATIALGIGANIVILAAVRGVLLTPLPFEAPDRLVQVVQTLPGRGGRANVTPAAAVAWEARTDVFAASAAYAYTTANLTGTTPAERIPVALVAGGFFRTLGVAPLVGRALDAGDAADGAPPVTVVSWTTWQRRFGGRPDVTGGTLRLGATTYRIVGVMPRDFEPLSWRGADLWLPLRLDPANVDTAAYRVVARLADGVTPTVARLALEADAADRARALGADRWPAGVSVRPLATEIVGDVSGTFAALQGCALAVLLLACANLAHLLIARSGWRRREFAVRAALGAGRSRLARQALTEQLLLALAGGALGVLLAAWGIGALVSLAPAETPRLDLIRLDAGLAIWAFGLATACGLIVGVVPAFRLSRTRLASALGAGARAGVVPGRARSLRTVVVVEMALAVLLVSISGVLAGRLRLEQRVDVGLDRQLAAAEVSLPGAAYPTSDAWRQTFAAMLDRVRALPGVTAVGLVDTLPMSQSWSQVRYRLAEGDAAFDFALSYRVAGDYFHAAGIRVEAGRAFDAGRRTGAPSVLVSHALARRHWPDGSAVGRRIWLDGVAEPFTVQAVVGDVHHRSLADGPEAALYFSAEDLPVPRAVIVARTDGDPSALLAPMRVVVAAIDPQLPLFNTRTTDALRADLLALPRLLVGLVSAFAVLALVLGLVGVHAVVALTVAAERRETGVRLALGASPGALARGFLARGLTLSAAGLGVGLGLSIAAGTALARVMDLPRPDAALLGLVTVALASAALLACAIPARRALRTDPVEVMRSD